MRRLFSAGHVNPTLGTLAEVAAALGMRVVLEPLDAEDRKQITGRFLRGARMILESWPGAWRRCADHRTPNQRRADPGQE